jgi:hypothetical protein
MTVDTAVESSVIPLCLGSIGCGSRYLACSSILNCPLDLQNTPVLIEKIGVVPLLFFYPYPGCPDGEVYTSV